MRSGQSAMLLVARHQDDIEIIAEALLELPGGWTLNNSRRCGWISPSWHGLRTLAPLRGQPLDDALIAIARTALALFIVEQAAGINRGRWTSSVGSVQG